MLYTNYIYVFGLGLVWVWVLVLELLVVLNYIKLMGLYI